VYEDRFLFLPTNNPLEEITFSLTMEGPGARAIVGGYAKRSPETGKFVAPHHVWNAVNLEGTIYFPDGQRGLTHYPADDFEKVWYMITWSPATPKMLR
jgi:hypothetical protein